MGSGRGTGTVGSQDGVDKAALSQSRRQGAGADVGVVVEAEDDGVAQSQNGVDGLEKVAVEDCEGVRCLVLRRALGGKMAEMLGPNRAKSVRRITRAVRSENGEAVVAFALKTCRGPATKASRIVAVRQFVGKESLVNRDACPTPRVSSAGRVGRVGGRACAGTRGGLSETGGERVLGTKAGVGEAVFDEHRGGSVGSPKRV